MEALLYTHADGGTRETLKTDALKKKKAFDLQQRGWTWEIIMLSELGQRKTNIISVNSVAQSCPSLCNPVDCSTPGLPVHHRSSCDLYAESKKEMAQRNLFAKQKHTHRLKGCTYGYSWGRMGGSIWLGSLGWTCYVLFSKPCPTLCDPMDCSTPGFPVLYHLLEFARTHVH